MARVFFRLTLLVGLLLSVGTCASDKALVFQDDCSAVSGPATGEVLCFDRRANVLKIYDGTRFISDVTGTGILNVKDFGASPTATAKANTIAFRAANAAITNGTIVFTPPGTYLVTPGIIYTLDSASGDHNGVGDTIVQVKEAIDPAVIMATTGPLAIQMGPTPSGPTQVTYTSYVAGAPGRFTLSAPLPSNLSENNTAEVDALALFNPMGKTDVRILGAGWDLTEIKFDTNGSGRIVGRTDCQHCELAYMKITGTQSNGYPFEQVAWVTGDGGPATGAKYIHIHDIHGYKLSQLSFFGIKNTDYEFDHFICENVHACLQQGTSGLVADAVQRINIHDFSYKADPVGTDDGFAFFGPVYDITISRGVMDKGNATGGHAEHAHRGNCIVLWTGDVAGADLKRATVSDVECRNGATTEYLEPPEVPSENPNNGAGINIQAIAGAVVQDVQITNFTGVLLRRGVYANSTHVDGIQNLKMTNIRIDNTSKHGMDFTRVKGLQLSNFRIVRHSQYRAAQGIFHTVMTDMDIHDGVIDGTGAVATSLGIQNGYPASGAIRQVKVLNSPSDGFWFPATDITGPFEFTDNRAENNGRYGFNGNAGVTAMNGLVLRNNNGSGNTAGLFNGF